mgnify:CR=1 FL=1
MWCPFCSHENTRVVDSRLTRDGMQIRRRRQCEECGARFNTYEAPEIKAPRIIKTDGTREAFSEDKLRTGMLRALEKAKTPERAIEGVANAILYAEGVDELFADDVANEPVLKPQQARRERGSSLRCLAAITSSGSLGEMICTST